MTVVSDTTTLSNLLHIGQLALLKVLFGTVLVPEEVLQELSVVEGFSEAIQQADYIVPVHCDAILETLRHNASLDAGERAAISYAVYHAADLLIIDELNGRKAATVLGLRIIGTIGILIAAKRKKYLTTIKQHLDELRKQGFWMSEKIYLEALKLVHE